MVFCGFEVKMYKVLRVRFNEYCDVTHLADEVKVCNLCVLCNIVENICEEGLYFA